MSKQRPPLAERMKQGLRDGISAACGERTDLIETWVDLDEANEALRKSIHSAAEPAQEDGRAEPARKRRPAKV